MRRGCTQPHAHPPSHHAGGNCFTHDLNSDPSLSFIEEDACYDAVLCALGVQYLEQPEMVFAEVRPEMVLAVVRASALVVCHGLLCPRMLHCCHAYVRARRVSSINSFFSPSILALVPSFLFTTLIKAASSSSSSLPNEKCSWCCYDRSDVF